MGSGKTFFVSSGRVGVSPNFTLSAVGTLNFNDQPVIIKSIASGTGMIGQITGTLSGVTNVTVERFMDATAPNRGYRNLASSVNTAGSIKANWQKGANNINLTDNQAGTGGTGYGTHITGSTTGADGFDATQTG